MSFGRFCGVWQGPRGTTSPPVPSAAVLNVCDRYHSIERFIHCTGTAFLRLHTADYFVFAADTGEPRPLKVRTTLVRQHHQMPWKLMRLTAKAATDARSTAKTAMTAKG